MSDIGIQLGIEGEKAFNTALKDINSGLKLLSSEMRAVSSQFLDNNKSIEAYIAKNQVLAKQIDAQKEKVEALKQMLEKSTQMYGENDKKTQQWATKLNTAQAELNKMNSQLKNNNSELAKYGSLSESTANSVGVLDKELSALQNDLEGIDQKYKKNKNSAQALEEKQKTLTNIFSKQSEKVLILSEALENSKNAFGKGSEETKKFEKALSHAETELKSTETELKKVDTAMQNSGQSAKTFGDMLKANLSAQAITAGIKKLADTAKDLKNYIMGGIKSAASFGHEMSAMSEKTGIGAEILQKFGAAAKMTEVDVNTFTKSYSKSIKSMNSVDFDAKNLSAMSKAYQNLGVEVRDSSGNLRDAQEVFWETVDGLKNMENETERNAVAMQIFGKSAMDLNPIIKRGSEGFEELTKNVATFDDQTMESLRGLDISMQKFGGVMDGIKRSIGVAFAPMMKEIADTAANAGGKLRGLFTAISKGEDQETINKKFEEFKKAVVDLAEKIKEQMPLFIDVGGKILGALFEGLMTAFGPILPQIASWGLLVATGFAAWSALIATAIATWPVALGLALAGVIIMFWPQISGWLTELWDNITKFFSEHWQDMLLWIVSWPLALIKTLNDLGVWEKLGHWLKGIFDNISKWFSNLKDTTVNKTKEILTNIVNWFKKLPQDIWNAIVGAVEKMAQWGQNLLNTAKNVSKNIWETIINGLKNLPAEITKIGGNLIKGLWDGINGMINWVKDKIMGFAKNVTGWLKNFFGIQSPSKLFKDEIGKNLALGIGAGFTDKMDDVVNDMKTALPTSLDYDLKSNVHDYSSKIAPNQDKITPVKNINEVDYMVNAFKKALSGMAFEIDGDKVGEMVVARVERVIFA